MQGTDAVDARDRAVAPSRRQFLSLAAAGTLAGVGGATGVAAQSQPETIRLGGQIAGWQGRKPDAIAGETNPTLRLEPGTTYRVVWTNLDGMGHNFALLDADGNVLERTEVMSEEGETQSLTFTAREAIAEYVCEPHITSMHGTVSVGGESATTPTTTETGDDTEPLIPTGPSVRLETVVDGGLTAPVDFEIPPGESGRRFVVDRVGQVYLHTDDGLREEPYVDVGDRLTEITGEMGLLGMAFHPDFQQNRRFYLRYSAPLTDDAPDGYSHTEVLAAFTAEEGSPPGGRFDRRLLEIPSPRDTHNAGAISFGPDGHLYMGMGDGGGAHDTGQGHVADWYDENEGGNGQDVTENLLGSILRIDVDGGEDGDPYGIPDDNPLVGKSGRDEHYAWGFRNPWRMGFSDGDLFAADVGQNLYEEVDRVEKGGNYGWNVREGTHCFEPGPEGSRNPPAECPERTPPDVRGGEPLRDPVIEYPHTNEGTGVGSAVIGGYVYDNGAIPALEGTYVFGDYRKTSETDTPTGSLFAATPTDDGLWSLEEIAVANTDDGTVGAFVLGIGRDHDGGLYVLSSGNPGGGATGAVHRIRPPNDPDRNGGTTAGNESTTAAMPTTNATANTTTTANATATPTSNATTTATTNATATANTTTSTSNATMPNATATTTPGSPTTKATAGTRTGTTADVTSTTTAVGSPEATATPTTAASGSGTTGGANTTNGSDASAGSNGSGPGFGALAAVSGLAIGVARLLAGRDGE